MRGGWAAGGRGGAGGRRSVDGRVCARVRVSILRRVQYGVMEAVSRVQSLLRDEVTLAEQAERLRRAAAERARKSEQVSDALIAAGLPALHALPAQARRCVQVNRGRGTGPGVQWGTGQ